MNKRRKLSPEREGTTAKFHIGDTKGYITANLFEDGTVGEIFLKIDKQGSTVSGLCDAWAIAVSIMLQTGVPLAYICQKYRGQQFEPAGLTGNPQIPIAKSPVDYVSRWLENRFLHKHAAVIPLRPAPPPPPPPPAFTPSPPKPAPKRKKRKCRSKQKKKE